MSRLKSSALNTSLSCFVTLLHTVEKYFVSAICRLYYEYAHFLRQEGVAIFINLPIRKQTKHHHLPIYVYMHICGMFSN